MLIKSILIILLIIMPLHLSAQDIQIPFDNENKVQYIDQELERELQLFTEYSGFSEARLFRINDSSFVLEVSYEIDSRMVRKRLNMSLAEVNSFKQKVSDRTKSKAPHISLNHEGRTRMLIGNTVIALAAYGWMLPIALEVDDGKGFMALYSLTGAAGFFIPYLATRNRSVTDAAATLNLWGGVGGMAHGALLYTALGGEDFQTGTAVALLTGISESIIGYIAASETNMTAGKADVIVGIGTFGFGYGLGTALLADAEEAKSITPFVLLGSFAGIFAGNFIANTQNYSVGDAYILNNTGIIGGYIPLAIITLSEIEDRNTYISLLMGGTTLGLWLGDYLVRGYDFTEDEGSYITYGTLAGSLLGSALGYAISSDEPKSVAKMTSLFGAIGASAGFGIMYNAYASNILKTDDLGALDIDFSPLGLSYLLLNNDKEPSSNFYANILNISYKF